MKKLAKTTLIAIFVFLVAGIILYFQQPARSQWLEGFRYRYPIVVEERSGTRLNDYQIKIILNSLNFDFSKVKPDGSDIRFADENGRLYPYWIEKWPDPGSSSQFQEAVVWVKIDSIEPFEKKKLYLYYGNPDAASFSNLIQTMDFLEVISEVVGSKPTTLTFSFNHDLVLPSPPVTEVPQALTVYVYKENGVYKAVATGSSSNPSPEGSHKTFFLGLNKGTYKLDTLTIITTTATISSLSSDYISEPPTPVITPGNLDTEPLYLAGILNKPSDNLQLRLLNPCLRIIAPYGAALTFLGESDNTSSEGLNHVISLFRFETTTNQINAYEVSHEKYVSLMFSQITTRTSEIALGDIGAVFCSLAGSFKESVFQCLAYKNESYYLEFVKDETAASGEIPEVKLTLLGFTRTGIFPIAKKASVEPKIRLARIQGKVYDDKDIDGVYEPDTDKPMEGVKVRLYKDTNKNGKIDQEDVFIEETSTDKEGCYYFPALENQDYLVAVSAFSAGKKFALESDHSYFPCPEQVAGTSYINGSYVKLERFGGENPCVSDYWSEDPDPAFNVYEHFASIQCGGEELINGIDFGFSFELVVNTIDSDPPPQGSLRQAIINSNLIPGKQKIRFYLNSSDPQYSELLSEYLIELKKQLPPLTDTVEIEGKNLNKSGDGSTIILSGAENNLPVCFEVYAPGSKFTNIKIAGFKKGMVFSLPQYELPIRKENLTSKFLAVNVNSNICQDFDAISKTDFSSLRSFTVAGFKDSTLTLISGSETSVDFCLLGRIAKVTGKPENIEDFYRQAALAPRETMLVVSGNNETRVKIDSKFLKLTPFYGFLLPASDRTRFLEGKNLSLISATENKGIPFSFSGLNFTVPVPVGFRLQIFSPFVSLATVTAHYGNGEQTSATVSLPYDFSSGMDTVIAIDATAPVFARLATGNSSIPVPYASFNLCGIFKDNILLATSQEAEVTLFISTDSTNTSLKAILKPGKVYHLDDFGEAIPSNDEFASAYILSSKPITAIGTISEGSQESYLPFVPEEILSTRFDTNLRANQLIVVAYAPTVASLAIGSDESTFSMSGTQISPETRIIDTKKQSFSITADKPIYACFKESLTGQYLLPDSIFDAVLLSLPARAESVYAFDSESLVERVSFLSCDKGIVIQEGCGIQLKENHYVTCGIPVDLGDNGSDPLDDSISSDLPNLGVDRPVITSAIVKDSTLTVTGFVGSTESATFNEGKVEIYLADKNGQPYLYFGETTVNDGNFTFVKPIADFKLTPEDFVMAVFTFKDGSSSEFSEPFRIDPAPVIYEVKATHIAPLSEESSSTLVTTITWYTDIPATSKVVYDVISHAATETYTYETPESTELVTTHTVVISGLNPNTLYYFRVISRNEYGDTGISYEFMIPPGRTAADTDLCAACHRAHTGKLRPLRLPYYVRE